MPTPQEIIEAFDNEEVDEMCGVSQREWLKQALADYTAYLISVMEEQGVLPHVHDILSKEIDKLKV